MFINDDDDDYDDDPFGLCGGYVSRPQAGLPEGESCPGGNIIAPTSQRVKKPLSRSQSAFITVASSPSQSHHGSPSKLMKSPLNIFLSANEECDFNRNRTRSGSSDNELNRSGSSSGLSSWFSSSAPSVEENNGKPLHTLKKNRSFIFDVLEWGKKRFVKYTFLPIGMFVCVCVCFIFLIIYKTELIIFIGRGFSFKL